jgi:hypothetical protein
MRQKKRHWTLERAPLSGVGREFHRVEIDGREAFTPLARVVGRKRCLQFRAITGPALVGVPDRDSLETSAHAAYDGLPSPSPCVTNDGIRSSLLPNGLSEVLAATKY